MRRLKGIASLALCVCLLAGSVGNTLAAEQTETEQIETSVSSTSEVVDDSVEGQETTIGESGETDVIPDMPETEEAQEELTEDSGEEEEPDVVEEEAETEEDSGSEMVNGEQTAEDEQMAKLLYRVHVQSAGWNNWAENDGIIGTTGREKRLEAIQLKIEMPESEETGGIEYRVHAQSYGWMDWVTDGQTAGTTGQEKRLEAIQIRLTGSLAERYDIYYRAHIQSYGWMNWAKNGEKAGSLGYAKRMEALEICLIEKGGTAPEGEGDIYVYPIVSYQAHVQAAGWQSEKFDGQTAGLTGQAKRLEALKIKLPDSEYEGGIEYRAYVQSLGWQEWKRDGQTAGTTGQGKRIEAIEIRLTGEVAEHYDVYYSIHMAKLGWTNHAVNGETVGSTDLSKRIEAVRIQLTAKGEGTLNTGGTKFIEGYKTGDMYYSGTIQGKGNSGNVQMGNTLGTTGQSRRLENITVTLNRRTEATPSGTIRYAVHLSKTGWTGWSEAGAVSGCTDGSRGIEAVKFSLSGNLSKYYDIYYRAYVQKYGWLGWAKNGQAAGTSKISYRLEAVQIRLVSKDANAPGANTKYYTEQEIVSGPDAGMYARANMYSSSTPYIVLVDRGNRKIGVYQGWQGAWRNVKYWSCTVGAPSTPTVSGVFKVGSRGYYFNSGNVRCFWWTQFYGDYLFHSTTYYHNGAVADSRLGLALSHGCVRLDINNAKWIYDTIPSGTTVVVYN